MRNAFLDKVRLKQDKVIFRLKVIRLRSYNTLKISANYNFYSSNFIFQRSCNDL